MFLCVFKIVVTAGAASNCCVNDIYAGMYVYVYGLHLLAKCTELMFVCHHNNHPLVEIEH